jgi:Protein of unknown function (DUF3102)
VTEITVTNGTIPVAANPVLAEHAVAIRDLAKRTRENIIEIARHLVESRNQVGRGEWLAWLDAAFGWSDQTAYRFIHVYELSRDARFHTCVELDLPLGVLYQLAATKAEGIRQEITERLDLGEKVTAETVIQAITGRRKSPAKTDSAESSSIETENVGNADDDAGVSAGARKSLYAADADADQNGHGGDEHLVDGDEHLVDGVGNEITATEQPADLVDPASIPKKSRAKKASLLEAWESTPEERQLIGDLVLEEFFARADGTDIFDRIPTARRKEVCLAFLDQLTVEGMLGAMSPEFGEALRARLPAKRKNINLIANSAHPRGPSSRH